MVLGMEEVFVTPDSSSSAYQDLAKVFAAIEPPTWSLLLAESCRAKGFEVAIVDGDAERLSLQQTVKRIENAKPRLVVMVLYGQNPNSGTTSMIGAIELAGALKAAGLSAPICFVGSHTSALPKEVLAYPCVDIVLLNEGVYALHSLLRSNLKDDLRTIKGIGYKVPHPLKPELVLNAPEQIVPQSRM